MQQKNIINIKTTTEQLQSKAMLETSGKKSENL